MARKELGHGLRAVATRRRLKEERIDENAAGAHSHVMAVEAHRDWHRRRIDEALAKATDKPVALRTLAKLKEFSAAPRGLTRGKLLLLMVIENRLAKGEDLDDRPAKPKPRTPPKRPQWMFDPSLLPKKPPGAT